MNSNNNDNIVLEYYIGERIISDDGYKGTIRYIGSVDGFEGNWYGIEWDDNKRGKHFGTVKGKQYFTCNNKGSGSFLKFEKLVKGSSFMTLLFEKFNRKLDDYNDLYVNSTKENVKIQIQMIGMDQTRNNQKNLSSQSLLSAADLNISEIDNYPIIYNSLKNLVELNLTNCLLNNWNQIVKLVVQLPQLNRLHLSNNRLEFNESEFKQEIGKAEGGGNGSNVKDLIMANLNLSNWYTVSTICECLFPQIEYLCIPLNSITTVTETTFTFPQLTTLDLANNNISNFNDIKSIGNFKNLIELNLNNNQISNIIEFNGNDGLFENLNILYLSNNKIDDWNHLDKLDQLKSLEELSFRDNPIIDSLMLNEHSQSHQNQQSQEDNNNSNTTSSSSTTKTVFLNRLNIIPRLSKLKKLNLSHISSIERRDAELYFLYENYNPFEKTRNSKKLSSLIEIHGEPSYTKLSLQHYNDNNINK